jgi:SNF2 family DNA or RNA helicase
MNTLYPYQETTVQQLMQWQSSGLIADCGTGKCAMLLNLFLRKKLKKLLIICPRSVMESAWGDDIPKFAPHLTFQMVWHANMAKRKLLLAQPADIYIINYQAVGKCFNELVAKQFDMCILDESTFIKNPTSHRCKDVLKLRKYIPSRHIATGTPGHEPLHYWSQWSFIHDTPFLGCRSWYDFRKKFYYEIPLPTGISLWKFNANYTHMLNDALYTNSIRLFKAECQKYLPARNFIRRYIDLPPSARSIYKQMEKESVADIPGNDDKLAAFFETTRRGKLRQMANGYVIRDDRGYARTVHNIHTSKLEECRDIIDNVLEPEESVIIWSNFVEEIRQLEKELGYPSICGGTKNANQLIADFKAGKLKGIIAHPASVAHGITWTTCHNSIYFGLPEDTELFCQSLDRTHRNGQIYPCNYFLILARKTIDEDIWKDHERKKIRELTISSDSTFKKLMLQRLITLNMI